MPPIRFANHLMKMLLVLATTALPSAFATTTYTYTGTNYSSSGYGYNCTPPGDPTAGPCIAYSTAMHVQGWFSLDAPLPANFGPADISTRSDLKWSFSDGVNTYASADTTHALIQPTWFRVRTDATGKPVFPGTNIDVYLWQTAPAVNNYYDYINIGYQPNPPNTGDYVGTGEKCFALTGNACMTDNTGPNASLATSVTSGTWISDNPIIVIATAPAIGGWAGLGLLAAMLGFGFRILRR